MSELKIDGHRVELGEKRLVFNKSAFSFSDFEQKNITYSERVTLPRTKILDQIFFRPNSPNISGDKFNIFHSFKYSEFGTILFQGTCLLLKANENQEYEIQLIDSSFDLAKSLENNKLNSIDYGSFDFVFNSTNYNALKLLNNSVWLWPISSMSEKKTLPKNILSGNLAYSRPFFSVKRLLEKSFSDVGWSYELSTIASFLDKLIISARSDFQFTSYEKSFSGTFVAGLLTLSSPDFVKTDSATGTTLSLNFNSKIRFRGKIQADNDFILQIAGTSSAATDTQTQTFVINKGTFDYDLTTNNFTTDDATYDVNISFIGTGNIKLTDFKIYTLIDENDFGDIAAANFADFLVKTYDNLPDISQKDLFIHSLVSVGGFFNSDNLRKKLNIYSFADISKLNIVDWSTKFIEGSESSEKLTGYTKDNYFIYDNSDNFPENLGRGSFTINDITLNDASNIYESIFSASNEVEISSTTMLDNTVYGASDSVDKRINNINNLIAYYEQIGGASVARFDKLNGNNILSLYYSNFIESVKKGQVFEANFNLNKSDFYLFDFTKLVYIKKLETIFWVLNISEYIEGEKVKVLLLKY